MPARSSRGQPPDPGPLVEQLDIDSMASLNIVVALNERTGIEIPERDCPKLPTVNDAVSYLARAQEQVAGA